MDLPLALILAESAFNDLARPSGIRVRFLYSWMHPTPRLDETGTSSKDEQEEAKPTPRRAMDRVPRTHIQELRSALRPAVPGLAFAVATLVLAVASIVVALVSHPVDLLASLAALAIAAALGIATMSTGGVDGLLRKIALPAAILAASVSASLLLLRGRPAPSVSAVILSLLSVGMARFAVQSANRRPPIVHVSGTPVGPATHPVLFANPRSGGGTAERVALAMGALEAFGHAEERRIDLGVAGDRVFVQRAVRTSPGGCSSGRLGISNCDRAVRSRGERTAKPWSSTRRFGSGACRAPSGCECPPERPADRAAYPDRWTIARMLPSVSLTHARRSP